ncbi:major facilitator superfamily transporter [Colletotrichum nymphaeae SA-01]|uniref:Major facilitator superfamily transporter n=1 Tax=Colletotrichum nymphaeae SA-01 TaxID=1460502 RepID=A0A135THQ3_9PEZI|nr:major facilitator superfamily transporter [Colletotrichum nymphaeae SA-01]
MILSTDVRQAIAQDIFGDSRGLLDQHVLGAILHYNATFLDPSDRRDGLAWDHVLNPSHVHAGEQHGVAGKIVRLVSRSVHGQGFGIEGLTTLTNIIVIDLVTSCRSEALLGLFKTMRALGSACGPIVGAALPRHRTWRLAFWVNPPDGIPFDWPSSHTLLSRRLFAAASLAGLVFYSKRVPGHPIIHGNLFSYAHDIVAKGGDMAYGVAIFSRLCYPALYYIIAKEARTAKAALLVPPNTVVAASASATYYGYLGL